MHYAVELGPNTRCELRIAQQVRDVISKIESEILTRVDTFKYNFTLNVIPKKLYHEKKN